MCGGKIKGKLVPLVMFLLGLLWHSFEQPSCQSERAGQLVVDLTSCSMPDTLCWEDRSPCVPSNVPSPCPNFSVAAWAASSFPTENVKTRFTSSFSLAYLSGWHDLVSNTCQPCSSCCCLGMAIHSASAAAAAVSLIRVAPKFVIPKSSPPTSGT